MTQYSRRPSGFCRREQFIAGAKADSDPVEAELDSLYSEWLQRAPVEGQGAIIAAQTTYMNDLALQEAVLQQQCDEETAVLQINAELARQCALLCSMLHNEQ